MLPRTAYISRVIANITILAYNINMPIDDYFKMQLHKKPIGIGKDIFANMGKAYYVDKTLLVRDIIYSETSVILFTRPRRFGKTLNMTMLQTFFEKPLDGKDTSHYFKDLKIWQCGEEYTSEQGKRPVIMLSFKDMKMPSFELAYEKFIGKISNEYCRHSELAQSKNLSERELGIYNRLAAGTANNAEVENSILYLCQLLEKHHGIKPLLLIDEYDVPLQESWYAENRYYGRMVAFIKNMLSAALKTNPSLYKGILTGVTRVSKESIFSGLNNIVVNTVFDEDFSEYFGFTQEEVNEMFRFYGIEDKLEEAKNWYDGYIFGDKNIYNPWSILCYLNKKCKAEPYWINVSSNDLAKDAIRKLDENDRKSILSLMSGDTVRARASTEFVYTELGERPEHAYGLLVQTGYLRASRAKKMSSGYLCTMEIPNRELYSVFSEEIVERIIRKSAYVPATGIQDAILDGEAADLEQYLSDFLLEMCSYLNLTEEKDYQHLIIGLCGTMRNGYAIHPEREAGHGRADIVFTPRLDYEEHDKLPGIIMELKHIKAEETEKDSTETIETMLQDEAEKALKQIETKKYVSELQKSGADRITRYGIAFSGKYVKIIRRSE